MEERSCCTDCEAEKVAEDQLMLPGFRFHPTDEELVGFYLKRKIQQRPLLIELIKQIDIYKYDPWDLPKLGCSGEKEWYFYCPRDRKYRNSARPNRVTGAGFWKATGTDRPIYSSDANKCIGLKKSLVFYKGRAAKGLKTDWMMHEFRLPSLTDPNPPKRFMHHDHKTILPPANDSWAICRIFKKTNSSAQRALSLSSISPPPISLSETNTSKDDTLLFTTKSSNLNLLSSMMMPFCSSSMEERETHQNSIAANSYPFDFVASYKPNTLNTNQIMMNNNKPSQLPVLTELSSPTEPAAKCRVDLSSILLNMSSSVLGDFHPHEDHQEFISNYPLQANLQSRDDQIQAAGDQFGDMRSSSTTVVGYPFHNLPALNLTDSVKSSLIWDSSSSCPSEVSTSFSTTNCYTS